MPQAVQVYLDFVDKFAGRSQCSYSPSICHLICVLKDVKLLKDGTVLELDRNGIILL